MEIEAVLAIKIAHRANGLGHYMKAGLLSLIFEHLSFHRHCSRGRIADGREIGLMLGDHLYLRRQLPSGPGACLYGPCHTISYIFPAVCPFIKPTLDSLETNEINGQGFLQHSDRKVGAGSPG